MIDYRARNEGGHILTIEDPIEDVRGHSQALVNQREVGIDTHSYAKAFKNSLREATAQIPAWHAAAEVCERIQ